MTWMAMLWLVAMVVVTCICIALSVVGVVWLVLEWEQRYLRRLWELRRTLRKARAH